MDYHHRTIAHFDLDAFYVACERELNPSLLLNQPVAVSQYNPYGNLQETHFSQISKRLVVQPRPKRSENNQDKDEYNPSRGGGDRNGSLIAVSYEARAQGVKRGDRGMEAVKKCPGLYIVQVPVKRGKADLTLYRSASNRVMEVLISSLLLGLEEGDGKNDDKDEDDSVKINGTPSNSNSSCCMNIKRSDIKVEKASIDEIYIDLTIPVKKMMTQIKALQNHHRSQNHDTLSPSNSQLHENGQTFEPTSFNVKSPVKDNMRAIQQLWSRVLHYGQKLGCTAIGGIETMSSATIAMNQLSKDELRKGSHFQSCDNPTNENSHNENSNKERKLELDYGSTQWWNRPLDDWTDIEIRLACGSALSAKARQSVQSKFEQVICSDNLYTEPGPSSHAPAPATAASIFTLSGGISTNKTLAKLASGYKKPNRQTMINPTDTKNALKTLFHPLKINRLRGFGGKFGEALMHAFDISTVGELADVPLTTLKQKYPSSLTSSSMEHYGKSSNSTKNEDRPIAEFIHAIAQGICTEEVSERTVEKSMSSGKTFRGALAISINDKKNIHKWISELVSGLLERLNIEYEEHKRIPTILVLSMKLNGVNSHGTSKSMKAPSSSSHEAYVTTAMKLYQQFLPNNVPSASGSNNSTTMQKKGGVNDGKSKVVSVMVMGITVTASSFTKIAIGKSSITGAFQFQRTVAQHNQEQQEGKKEGKNIIHTSNSIEGNKKTHILSSPLSSTHKKKYTISKNQSPLIKMWKNTESKNDTHENNQGMYSTSTIKRIHKKCNNENDCASKTTGSKRRRIIIDYINEEHSHKNAKSHITKDFDKESSLTLSPSKESKKSMHSSTTTMFHSDDDENATIDKDVLSQLPVAIQSEIRVATMSQIGLESASSFHKKRIPYQNNGAMKDWLIPSASNNKGDSTNAELMQEKTCPKSKVSVLSSSSTLFAKMKKQNIHEGKEGSNNNKVYTPNSKMLCRKYYTGNDAIDPNVFAELPFHIQAMIRKELHPSMNKSRKS